jgi:Raf kinase inhibitor-like YbhB/YbcL family protein
MLIPMLAGALALLSPQFVSQGRIEGAHVWNRDGCHGANRSPALRWANAPANVRSFALTVFDPDAGPAGWWHWIVYDIPAGWHGLPADAAQRAPSFAQGFNDFGTLGYGGPCPPPGPPHHYVFTLYALGVARLSAASPLRGPQFRRLISGHVLATTTLTGVYGR